QARSDAWAAANHTRMSAPRWIASAARSSCSRAMSNGFRFSSIAAMGWSSGFSGESSRLRQERSSDGRTPRSVEEIEIEARFRGIRQQELQLGRLGGSGTPPERRSGQHDRSDSYPLG